MKKEELLKQLEELDKHGDLMIEERRNGDIWIIIDDFEEYDDDWGEEFRECEIDEDELEALLEKDCIEKEVGLYIYYDYEDFSVMLGYSSYEI